MSLGCSEREPAGAPPSVTKPVHFTVRGSWDPRPEESCACQGGPSKTSSPSGSCRRKMSTPNEVNIKGQDRCPFHTGLHPFPVLSSPPPPSILPLYLPGTYVFKPFIVSHSKPVPPFSQSHVCAGMPSSFPLTETLGCPVLTAFLREVPTEKFPPIFS